MSEYQRFISYMYEYRGNNRFANCGYARIDNRNQLLKLEIHMKISSQSTEEPIRIYGCFQRDGQLYGVELGQHVPALGMVNWRTQCSALKLSGTDISFSDLEGLILTDQSPLSYCSIWNDQSIRPLDMLPYPSPESEMMSEDEPMPENNENSSSITETIPPTVAENVNQENIFSESTVHNTSNPEFFSGTPMNNANQPDISAESSINNANQPKKSPGATINSATQPKASPDFNTYTTDQMGSSSVKSPDPQMNLTASVKESSDQMIKFSAPEVSLSASSSAKSGDSSKNTSKKSAQILPELSDENTPDDFDKPASTVSAVSTPRTSPTLVEKIMAQEYKMPKPESFSKNPSENDVDNTSSAKPSAPSRWDRLTSQYPRADVFSDGELKNCVRIEPRDFPRLRREGWNIAGNRFILHCFQRNAHCLIGRINDTEQYVFAVPGIYDNQERFMANMFGFPCFKSTDPDTPLTNGQKGYWYRSLH